MIVMPEMALAPDMSGVCNVGGTFVINSKPTKMASTKMYNAITSGSPTITASAMILPYASAFSYPCGNNACVGPWTTWPP